MTATTNLTLEPNVWTAVSAVDPTTFIISSNQENGVARLRIAVAAAGVPPAADFRGHLLQAGGFMAFNSAIVGQIYAKADDYPHEVAITA